jgi:acetyl esterase/lipase
MTRVIDRRHFLLAAAAGGLAACSAGPDPSDVTQEDTEVERITYGTDPSQYGELYRPAGRSRGVVVVIHGGFWKAMYDATLGRPPAEDLADKGWTAWNLEYRRVGNGGGAPQTFDDVAAGIDRLADVPDLDLTKVVTLGHSAGGHLATWAAGRARFGAWRPARVPVTAVISQAGVVDLVAAYRDDLGDGAVKAFVGEPPGPDYLKWDPQQQIPLDVPVWCVHGTEDETVPFSQSEHYVARARREGAGAVLVEVPADHMAVFEPSTDAWARSLRILDGL